MEYIDGGGVAFELSSRGLDACPAYTLDPITPKGCLSNRRDEHNSHSRIGTSINRNNDLSQQSLQSVIRSRTGPEGVY